MEDIIGLPHDAIGVTMHDAFPPYSHPKKKRIIITKKTDSEQVLDPTRIMRSNGANTMLEKVVMMHQIRKISKTKTMVVFQLQPINSSVSDALVFSYAYICHSSDENSRFSLPAVENTCRTQPQRARGRYTVVSTPDHFISNTSREWIHSGPLEQTSRPRPKRYLRPLALPLQYLLSLPLPLL